MNCQKKMSQYGFLGALSNIHTFRLAIQCLMSVCLCAMSLEDYYLWLGSSISSDMARDP